MSAFFGQEFLQAQYFRPQYLHGAGGTPPTQDGKSGYWRLFFYKMQEEALKTEEPASEATAQPAEQPRLAKAPKKKARKPYEVKEQAYEPITFPPFIRKAVYTQPSSYEKIQGVEPLPAPVLIRHNRDNVVQLNLEKIKRKQRARRRAAAFLLLAA